MTPSRRAFAVIAFILVWSAAAPTAQIRGANPLRVIMLVDSSAMIAPMLTQFRAGLNAFLDELPGSAEIAIISTGGQLRIRVPPTTDRELLHRAADNFAPDGGANSLLDTMLEADRRFLRAPDRRPMFVILTTDRAAINGDGRIDAYNRFVDDFIARDGRAHGLVVRDLLSGITTDIVLNLTRNTGGFYDSINTANSVPQKMKAIADLVGADMPE